MMFAALVLMSCSDKNSSRSSSDDIQNTVRSSSHDERTNSTVAESPSAPVSQAIKKMMLKGYSQKTIGEAFDNYNKASSREWHEVNGKDGKYFVDYECWLNESALSDARKIEGIVKVGVNVKFVVMNSGDFFVAMVSRLQMRRDGKSLAEPLDPTLSKRVLEAIYTNTEMSFL